MVLDAVVVTVSLVCEWNEEFLGDHMGLFMSLRLWKACAFVFDICLEMHMRHEQDVIFVKGVKKAAKQPYREYSEQLKQLLESHGIPTPPGPSKSDRAKLSNLQKSKEL